VEKHYWQLENHCVKHREVKDLSYKHLSTCDEADRILTSFHQKLWLPTKEKSVPAYQGYKKVIILACCKASDEL
jgi:hypothetical protein